ncbi:cytochrome B [Pedobacter polaris]|uniref:Cytochrome B n=1 Tax=Pedobacter polaris TaxID=2571273 RepID=A0A4U1CV05_9SPHI|nr:cytochrome B [Pedobacter polaris]TKC12476.1 cytochrome B [Pedobacter polaris]
MNFYQILKSAHSGWRYIVFVLLVIAVIQALAGWFGKNPYTEGNRKLNVFTLVSAHIQLVFGLILYFLSPLTKMASSEAVGRYWKMEHISMMILAIILITVGNAKSKKVTDAITKHKMIAIFFGIALIIVVAAIFMMTRADASRTFFGVS